jgi:hypothetical protein
LEIETNTQYNLNKQTNKATRMASSGSKYMRFEDGAVQFQFSLRLSVIIRNIRAQKIDGQGHEASF